MGTITAKEQCLPCLGILNERNISMDQTKNLLEPLLRKKSQTDVHEFLTSELKNLKADWSISSEKIAGNSSLISAVLNEKCENRIVFAAYINKERRDVAQLSKFGIPCSIILHSWMNFSECKRTRMKI